jgi:UDP-glucose 4-epimerase
MRILVTGGAGFIGSHIVDAYLSEGHDVITVDNLWSHGGGRPGNVSARARFYQLDIRDAALAEVFEREKPEVVNHHAAQASVKVSSDDPRLDADINVLGLLNVLEHCRRFQVKKIIFASSSATYGTPTQLPLDEHSPQVPESPYGITKLIGEHYLRYYQAVYGLDYTAFRYGNVYGPRQDPNGEAGVISIFVNNMLKGQPVRIDWDGEQAKDYVFVEDVARASVLALRGGSGIYCIGTGVPTSVNAIYEALTDLLGKESPIIHAPKRIGDIRLCYLDSALAQEKLGWKPRASLKAGLEATIAHFQQA